MITLQNDNLACVYCQEKFDTNQINPEGKSQ